MKNLKDTIAMPRLLKVRQRLDKKAIDDAALETGAALAASGMKAGIEPGMRVAVLAGSRGIDRIDEVIKELVAWLKSAGASPFIVPAMGSHGGATPEGQKKLLEELGISLEKTGAEIESSMETRILGAVEGVDIHADSRALSADAIVLVNRIKPHTSFRGDYESGLSKMLAVGMGKRHGAAALHARGPAVLAGLVPKIAEFVLNKANVLFGVALIENAVGKLAFIEVVPAGGILAREPELLKLAEELLPRLPFREAEVLIVDRLGKSKSGTGLDTNVIGRIFLSGIPDPGDPMIRRIVVLDLAEGQGASAYGIGLADVTVKRVLDKMDPVAMRENAMASTFVERARVPLWFDTDYLAVKAAIQTCWQPEMQKLRLARIRDTVSLEEIILTEPLYNQCFQEMEVIEEYETLGFDETGSLLPW